MKPLNAILLTLLLTTIINADDNWPRFRGTDGTGAVADNAGLPISWSTTENVRWIADVPGWGWACPVVWGNKVFLTTVVNDEPNLTPSKGLYLGEGVRDPAKGTHHWLVYCFDLQSGKQLWLQEAHTGVPAVPRHPKSCYAAETAVTDGERVYALFGDVGLYCYDMDGRLLWSHRIDPKKTAQDYGAAASPVVHDGQVFVVYDNLEESWIASFDAKTGEQRWKKPRNETHSWATPLVWTNELRTEIVVPGKRRNRSYSLDGDLLWEFDGRMSNLVIPSPFVAHGLCYIASGYIGDDHRPTFAIRPGATGDITPVAKDFSGSEYIAWYQGKSSPYNPSQIVYGDYLYTLYDRGFLTCHDAKTGEEVYGKQRLTPGGSFTSSPWAYNGHLFFLSEDGLTYVVKAGPNFEIVERNELDEFCMACPAISGDKLLIRTGSKLYCMTQGSKLDSSVIAKMQPKKKAENYSDIFTAARDGKLAEVSRLLKSGVSVNVRQGGSGTTLLSTAAMYGKTDVVQLLIKEGADVGLASNDGNTPLLVAAFFCHTEVVQLLLDHGASTAIKNKRGETPVDVLSAEWSDSLATIYTSFGRADDLQRIQATRPKVLQMLTSAAKPVEPDPAGK